MQLGGTQSHSPVWHRDTEFAATLNELSADFQSCVESQRAIQSVLAES